MALDTIKFNWENEFSGTAVSPNGEFRIGEKTGELSPYNLLIGALGGCYYHTFVEIVRKKRLTFDRAEMEISGTRRIEEPSTLETALIRLTVYNASDEAKFLKSAQLSEDHCSIHNTLSHVARIALEVEFK